MGDLELFCERMSYWCSEGNLKYDPANRRDIRSGGSCDCSSLVVFALNEAGFETGSASDSSDIAGSLVRRGWKLVANDGRPRRGDILLSAGRHVAVWLGDEVAQVHRDELGGVAGCSEAEIGTCGYYNYPWDRYLRRDPMGAAGPGASRVGEAHRWLDGMGYRVGSDADEGIRGGETGRALTQCLQATLNACGADLTVDGSYEARTAEAYQRYGPVCRGCERRELVRVTQAALLAMSYDAPITGVCDERTVLAIRDFQAANGLAVDGRAGRATGYVLFC